MRCKRSAGGVGCPGEGFGDDTTGNTRLGRPRKRRFVCSDFPLRPRGEEGGPKRTPLHIGDPWAQEQSYQVEQVLAQCQKFGVDHFKVSVYWNCCESLTMGCNIVAIILKIWCFMWCGFIHSYF